MNVAVVIVVVIILAGDKCNVAFVHSGDSVGIVTYIIDVVVAFSSFAVSIVIVVAVFCVVVTVFVTFVICCYK